MVLEVRRGIDEAQELHDAFYPVEVAADGIFQLRQNVDGAEPCGLGAVFKGNVLAEGARVMDLAALDGPLAGDEYEVPRPHPWHVIGHGLGGLRQGNAEFGEALVDLSHVVTPEG